MWKSIASNALTLMIVALIAVAGVIAWGQGQYRSAGPLDAGLCLRVESGSNMRRVAEELVERGAITDASIFRIGADYTDKASQLKAGAFLVPAGASMEEIVDIVTRAGASTCGTEVVYRIGVNRAVMQVRTLDPQTESFDLVADVNLLEDGASLPDIYTTVRAQADTRYRVLVSEGTTIWRVLESLKLAEFLSGDITVTPAEGMLAPDSYEVRADSDVNDLLTRMIDAQEARIAEVWETRQDDLPINSPEEMLTLASIIEKETAEADERRQVSSVFVNRLRKGMRLQTDPTVIYAATDGRGFLGRGIRQSELNARNPYNTYVIEGLPPGPIANPGLASLQAAVDPDVTPYIFFVADGTGGHAFAETLAEHNRNVARWREIERERANN